MRAKIKLISMVGVITLFLSLSAVVWAQDVKDLPENFNFDGDKLWFDSYGYQSAITTGKSLSKLIGQAGFSSEESAAFGFGAKSPEARFFLIGSSYSQAIAYFKGDNLAAAASSLKRIEQELINLRAPSALYNYVTKTRNILERNKYSFEALGEFISLLQPFLEDYAGIKGQDKIILFRAGSWLISYGLAAAAGDKSMLHETLKLRYFLQELERLDAPKGVLTSLNELVEISEKERITDSDTEKIIKLVKKTQTLLG